MGITAACHHAFLNSPVESCGHPPSNISHGRRGSLLYLLETFWLLCCVGKGQAVKNEGRGMADVAASRNALLYSRQRWRHRVATLFNSGMFCYSRRSMPGRSRRPSLTLSRKDIKQTCNVYAVRDIAPRKAHAASSQYGWPLSYAYTSPFCTHLPGETRSSGVASRRSVTPHRAASPLPACY